MCVQEARAECAPALRQRTAVIFDAIWAQSQTAFRALSSYALPFPTQAPPSALLITPLPPLPPPATPPTPHAHKWTRLQPLLPRHRPLPLPQRRMTFKSYIFSRRLSCHRGGVGEGQGDIPAFGGSCLRIPAVESGRAAVGFRAAFLPLHVAGTRVKRDKSRTIDKRRLLSFSVCFIHGLFNNFIITTELTCLRFILIIR